MKRISKTVTVLLLGIYTIVAPAQTVVYRETERVTVVGNSRQGRLSLQWLVVCDVASMRFATGIASFTANGRKFYAVSDYPTNQAIVGGIAGPKGDETVFFGTSSGTNANGIAPAITFYFMRGRDTALNLGNGATANLPAKLKGISRAIDRSNGFPAAYESTSTLQFDPEETSAANINTETPQQTIERIRQRLEAEGYVPAS